jgi:MFS family permease
VAVAAGSPMLQAFASRDFRLLWSGQSVSLLGNAAFLVAIGWRTYALTGSASKLSLVLLVETAAMLATLLLGGALADRYERRRLMISSDLARCGVVAGLAAVDASGHLSFGALLAFAAAVGLGDGFFHPAFGGIVPLVVGPERIASANALIGVSRQGSLLLGPALAAAVYAPAGSAAIFALDAGSFVVSAVLVGLARPRTVGAEAHEDPFRAIWEGIRYVASVPWLWISITLASVIVLCSLAPLNSLLPKLVAGHFGRGVGAYGLLFSLQGGGMIVGALLFGHLRPRRRRGLACYAGFLATDFAAMLLALAPWYPLGAVAIAARGAALGFAIAVWETMLMQLVPERLLSRAISVDFFGSLGLLPVGYAIVAVIGDSLSPSAVIAGGAAISAVLWLAGMSTRTIRAID